MFIFYASEQRYCRHWENCFVVDEFSRLFLHSSIFAVIHSRSVWIMNGAWSDFWYWLNSNNLMFFEGIIMLREPLFSYTLLCDWSLFFVAKEWKQFRQWKSPSFLKDIPFNNADIFLTAR